MSRCSVARCVRLRDFCGTRSARLCFVVQSAKGVSAGWLMKTNAYFLQIQPIMLEVGSSIMPIATKFFIRSKLRRLLSKRAAFP